MNHPTPAGFGTTLWIALLAMLTGWVALFSWGPIVESPEDFLRTAFAGGLVLAIVGACGRAARLRWYAVLAAQLVAAALFFNLRYAAGASWGHLVPTPASVRQVVDTARVGAAALNAYASPVPASHQEIFVYLALCSVGLLLVVDLLACGLGKVPLAGLPLLLIVSIPISILDSGLNPIVFSVTALLFLLLLATEEIRRVLGWGRRLDRRGDRAVEDSLDDRVSGTTVRSAALRIGTVTTLGALVLPALVPLPHHWLSGGGGQGGSGGGSGSVQTVNPITDLRRDLLRQTHTPLLTAHTSDPSPTYVRLSVLDEFTGDEWKPSQRSLPAVNRAEGLLPTAPGLTTTTPGRRYPWSIRLAENFQTQWLPTPYPTTRISVPGDWRYDLRTLDFVNVDEGDQRLSRGLSYTLTALAQQYDPTAMNDALSAPGTVLGPMTDLPKNLPAVIAKTALKVTKGATTDYQRAQMLQDWFRGSQFRYSLTPGAATGMQELASFITTDKVGYCVQFSAAMAVMARSLGIPARVVVGFRSPSSGTAATGYTYTTDDLHAWPEIYFAGTGWVPFEPTPSAHTGTAPSWTTATVRTETATTTPTPTAAAPTSRGGAHDVEKQTHAKHHGSGTPWWIPAAVLVLLLVVLAAVPGALRRSRRRARLARDSDPHGDPRRRAAGLWQELAAGVADLGIRWPAGRSVRVTIAELAARARPAPELAERLRALTTYVERSRYARTVDTDPDVHAAQVRTADDLIAQLAHTVTPWRRRWATWCPPSVFVREPERGPRQARRAGRVAGRRADRDALAAQRQDAIDRVEETV